MTEFSTLSLEGANEEEMQDGQMYDDPRRHQLVPKEAELYASLVSDIFAAKMGNSHCSAGYE